MNKYMELAINEAKVGINGSHGGPFGSVIVKNNKVIAVAHNQVLLDHDPTSHGEINAIKKACDELQSHDLSGCVLYTTAEPCPMCLCACMWANIDKIYYGSSIEDTESIGFRDKMFDKKFGTRKDMNDYLIQIDKDACLELFSYYENSDHKIY